MTHGHGLTGTPGAGRFLRTESPSYRHDVLRGIWDENPVFRQLLGLCPALAVSNTVSNSLAMGLATAVVLVGSSTLVSLLKGLIPHAIRLSTFILSCAVCALWIRVVRTAGISGTGPGCPDPVPPKLNFSRQPRFGETMRGVGFHGFALRK